MKKVIIIILVIIALLLGLGFAALNHYSAKLGRITEQTESLPESTAAATAAVKPAATPEPERESGVTNILVIGVDNDYAAGMEQQANADGLIIASINHDTKQIVLTSLMRDIKAELPNGRYTKLTLSYHQGGVPLLVETIERNFDIDIDNYVLVNYIDVVKIVDAVGGVTVELTPAEIYYMEEKIMNVNSLVGEDYGANIISQDQAGTFTMNGVQTAAYMRVRMAGNNDMERTERARRVILKIKDKLLDMSIKELDAFVDVALPCITTDMTQADILKIMLRAPAYLRYDMVSFRLPVDDSFYYSQDGNAYVVIDYDINRAALQETIYGRTE